MTLVQDEGRVMLLIRPLPSGEPIPVDSGQLR